MPRTVTNRGKYVSEFFNRKGELKRIRKLKYWSMPDVLTEKYDFTPEDAHACAAFTLPLLDFVPDRRVRKRQPRIFLVVGISVFWLWARDRTDLICQFCVCLVDCPNIARPPPPTA